MKNTMKLKDAVRFLRRYQDWRCGFDERTMGDSLGCDEPDNEFSPRMITDAIDRILTHYKMELPLIVCEHCAHFDMENGSCKVNSKGECMKYESIGGNVMDAQPEN